MTTTEEAWRQEWARATVLPWAPSRWDGRAWGFAMGEPWASHERRHSHEPRTIDIVNSIVTPSLDRVYNVVEIESY